MQNNFYLDLEKTPTEIKASGGLQECAEEDVSKADVHSALGTPEHS